MKKLLGILVLGLLWCNVGFAEMKLIEEKFIKGDRFTERLVTVCIDEYKFVYSRLDLSSGQAIALVQFFEERDGKSLPAKC